MNQPLCAAAGLAAVLLVASPSLAQTPTAPPTAPPNIAAPQPAP